MQTKVILTAFLVCSSLDSSSQTHHVDLTDKVALPDIHTTFFTASPRSQLRLPTIDTTGAMFFDLYYLRTTNDISFMAFNKDSGDVLYADLNYDGDLSNDGEPMFFALSQQSLSVDIRAKGDSAQITTFRLRRKPDVPDSIMRRYVTSAGDVPSRVVRIYNDLSKLGTGLGGKRGTFYFDERVTFRRGLIALGEEVIRIGISDVSNNGLYNDSEDQLLIDVNNDGKFDVGGGTEVFKLNDVFSIGRNRFEIESLDKYGRWMDIRETNNAETHNLLKERESGQERTRNISPSGEIKVFDNDSLWHLRLKSIDGTVVKLADFKGRYLFLNFWGEWCGPCIAEIPVLVEQYTNSPRDKIEFISFLKTSNLAKAMAVIQKLDMRWNQIVLDANLEEQFKIVLYPTNILVFPDGKRYVRVAGMLNKAFFEKTVH